MKHSLDELAVILKKHIGYIDLFVFPVSLFYSSRRLLHLSPKRGVLS